jgi:hypothetical protein
MKALNLYLQAKEPALELVKGRGYFYFANSDGFDCTNLPPSICIYALRSQSLEDWKHDIDNALLWHRANN